MIVSSRLLILLLLCSCSSLRQIERMPKPVVLWAKSIDEYQGAVVIDGKGKLHALRLDNSQLNISETFAIGDTLRR